MVTLTIELTDEQIVSLLRQLPAARRKHVLELLRPEGDGWWAATQRDAEAPLKRLAAEKGFDWDRMSDAERKALACDLTDDETPVPLTARSSKPGR